MLLAGGTGTRLGSGLPKQFLQLGEEPMLNHPLRRLDQSPRIRSVIVVLPAAAVQVPDLLDSFPKVSARVEGGSSRQGSLARAITHLPDSTGVILVHDAARPLLEADLIERVLDGLEHRDGCHGVIPGVRVQDTIKKVSPDGFVEQEVDRRSVWRVQTPQAFRRSALEDALTRAIRAGHESTDCSQMLTRAGYRVRVVEGDPWNLKVTTSTDLQLARLILSSRGGVA